MSISPIVPNSTIRSFWSRPEGTTGKVVLGLVVLAVGFVLLTGLATLAPILAFIMESLFHAVLAAAGTFVVGYVLLNKRFRMLVSYLFQSAMRFITGIFITIDPIGILNTYISSLQKSYEELAKNIGQLRGARDDLNTKIANNSKEIEQEEGIVKAARAKLSDTKLAPEKQLEYQVTMGNSARHAEAMRRINENLLNLRNRIQQVFDTLSRWKVLCKGQIEDKKNRVAEETMRRNAVQKGWSAFQASLKILRGNSMEDGLYDQTLEFLTQDASSKLGEMDDFNTEISSLLTNMDLKNEADVNTALARIDGLQQKLLTADTTNEAVPTTFPTNAAEPVLLERKAGSSSYGELLK